MNAVSTKLDNLLQMNDRDIKKFPGIMILVYLTAIAVIGVKLVGYMLSILIDNTGVLL